ncbi:hypothetical protein [Synechococcus sp. MU1611]|uniref:hypothetical protein n=1 Tax=Synechococcus sp. MU1611 TaxID=2508345 RepID=UPI001CF83EA8|nr:hypothetical protein [Synechococcus sp. MU1611]MCB4412114.1 hypothetical protein [Synechococcus sp. MU1611]
MDTDLICTRAFSRLSKTSHHRFCKAFFEKGEKEALKITDYCPINLKSHEDLFDNLPKDLDRQPIWWLMPWGGTLRKPDLNKEARIQIKNIYTARYLKLLKSVEKKGFIVTEDFMPPVHQLIKNQKSVYILQDGHHRSAIFKYLSNSTHQSLIRTKNNDSTKKIKVSNQLIVRNSFVPHLKYVNIGSNNGHFSLRDAFKWFDLAFEILDSNLKTQENQLENRLSQYHDKLLNKLKQPGA